MQHEVREQSFRQILGTVTFFELIPRIQLCLEGFSARVLDRRLQRFRVGHLFGILDNGGGHEESHQEVGHDELPIPLFRIFSREPLGKMPQRGVDHPQDFGLELFPPLERKEPQRINHLSLLVHHVVVLQQPLPRLEVL